MKIKRKKIYLSLLSLIIPISSSYTEDFKHDSVIPALKLGEYKILNGCPAILKTERKEEENCPVDYTGTIKYERTLTADKILFGDNVTCEKGGKWSDWKEIENNCVHIPPPKPDDLLKADSCKMVEVNGNADEWYVFRRNENEVFLKSNYDAAIASGMTAESYYSNLIKIESEKTYVSSLPYVCNIQATSSEFNKYYSVKNATTIFKPFSLSTLYAANYTKYGVTNLKLDISILNDSMQYTSVLINGNLTGNLKLKNMYNLLLSNINYISDDIILENIATTEVRNKSSIKANTFSLTGSKTKKLLLDNYNSIDIENLTYNGSILESRANNLANIFKVKNLNFDNLTPNSGGITIMGYNPTNFNVENLKINNYPNISFYNLLMSNVKDLDIKNSTSLTFQAGKVNLTTDNFNINKIKNIYLTNGAVINAPKINLIGNSILNNSGSYKKDTYINGDIYLDNNKSDNYIEALFGHLNGNVYTEDPSNYDLIDVNSCNAVYMNGKNTQWKAFKTNPDRAFLYDLYSTIPIKTIKKNLLDNFNKPYVKMNKTNDNCFLNVMFENDMDKDIKVTDANSKILSLGGSNETFYLPRNTNNIETIGSLSLTDNYFKYKGNIKIDNSASTSNTTPSFKIRQVEVDGDFTYIGNGVESFSGAANLEYGKITGNFTLSNVKNATFNAWVSVGKDTIFNNIDIINLNNFSGKKNLYIYKDDTSLPTFLNFYLGSNIGVDAYLNNIAFITFDNTGSTVKGNIYDARVDTLKDADFCSEINLNGSNSGWKYFESMPNIAFNERIFNDYNTNLTLFKKTISGTLRGQFESPKISGKYCVTTIENFGLDNQRNAEYVVTDNTYNLIVNRIYSNKFIWIKNPQFKSIDIAGNVYFNNGLDVTEFIKAYSLINNNSRHYVATEMTGDLKTKKIDVNTLSGSLAGNMTVDDINTTNFDISIAGNTTINNLNVKGDLYIRNLISATDANVNINNLNMIISKANTLFNVGINIGGFPPTSKVLLKVNNFTLTQNPSYNITTATKFTVNNIHNNLSEIIMPNGFKLDNFDKILVTFNNKNGAIVKGDVYLNNISYYEQDSNSKTFGNVYGGIKDYSSVGQ